MGRQLRPLSLAAPFGERTKIDLNSHGHNHSEAAVELRRTEQALRTTTRKYMTLQTVLKSFKRFGTAPKASKHIKAVWLQPTTAHSVTSQKCPQLNLTTHR